MIPYVQPGNFLFRFMDPDTPYFWTSVSEMLSDNQLFLNSRTNFNDPFDSQPVIEDDLKSSAIRQYLDTMIQNPLNPNRDPKAINKILNLISEGKTQLNKRQLDNIKSGTRRNAAEYLDECGILSFSLNPQNPLLWGHYAASFAGACVVFQRNSALDSIFSVCAKITYVGARPHLRLSDVFEMGTRRRSGEPYDDLAEQIFFHSFLHKDCHWASEQEARIFYPFGALQKKQFHSNEFVAIIAGPKSSSEMVTRLTNEIRAKRPSVAFHRASLSEKEFKIIIPHKYLRRRE